MRVNRRTVLAALGTAVATAGCFGQESPDPGSGSENGTSTPTDTPTDSPTDATTPDPDGPFADLACPSFVETDRTICWHTRAADAPVVLEPEATTYEPIAGNDAVETVGFTLHNRSEQPFGLNPHAWRLHVREDGEWRHIAPEQWIEPWNTVAPGETWDWVLATEQHPTPSGDRVVHVVQELTSATYAFSVHGQLGPQGETAESIECIAPVEVVATPGDSDATTTQS